MMAQGTIERSDHDKIDSFLEEYYESGKTRELGEKIAIGRMNKSQVRGLETLIASTRRFSEIINYVKNQTGKAKSGKPWHDTGPEILDHLGDLEAKAQEIAGEDTKKQMLVKLLLAQGWMRQIVAHYLYGRALQGD